MELILIAGFLCTFGVAGALIVGIVVWAFKHAKWKTDRLAKVGAELGLASEGPRRIAGHIGGVPCSVRFVTEGSGDNKSSWTYVEAEIDPPLRLGLNLRRQGWLGQVFSDLLGGAGVALSDPTFDGAFRLNAIEAEEVVRLFDAGFRSTCMRAYASFSRFWMTDDRVHASFRGHSTDIHKIRTHLDGVVGVARDAQRARRAMGPTARERAVIESWGTLATTLSYRFDPESLSLAGESGRHRFAIVPTLGQAGWSTRFRVTFGRPLGVALHLRREHALASVGRLFGMTDIEVGDPRFDNVFTIKGSNPDAIRHIFGDEALRSKLLALFAVAKTLEVHDDCVDAVASGLVSDGAALQRSLGRVVEIADGLRSRLDAPRVGAYR